MKMLGAGFCVLSMLCAFSFLPLVTSAEVQIVENAEMPLSISVRGISFDNTKRTLTFDALLGNNTDIFVDTIKYRIELYAGDALAKEGLLFSTVDFVYAAKGELGRLSPSEQLQQDIVIVVPETIPGANYFFRIFAHTEDDSLYGATFTEESTRLTGLGTFLPNLRAALIHPETKKPHALMEGPLLELGSSPFVVVMKGMNVDAFTRIEETPNEYFLSYAITHINEPEKIIVQVDNKPLKDFFGEDNAGQKGLLIPFAPWEGQLSGSHTAEIRVTDSRGNPVSDVIRARLLYKGLLGRIFTAESSINTYRRGEPIDLRVNVVAAGDEKAEKVTLVARLKATSGEVFEYRKDVPMNGTFQGIDTTVTFSDITTKKPMKVESIDLELLNPAGVVMDTHRVSMDTQKTFGYPKSFSWPWFIGIIAFLAVIGAVYTAHKKKLIKIPWLGMLLLILGIGFSFFAPVGDSNVAYAQWCGDGEVDAGEACDGDAGVPICPYGGSYWCTNTCELRNDCSSSSCGNGEIDPGEECDGTNTNGIYTCPIRGTPYCGSSCLIEGCDDGKGCMDETADNFDPTAITPDDSCYWTGCMDRKLGDGSNNPNYDPKATRNSIQKCGYKQLYGEMLRITASTPGAIPPGGNSNDPGTDCACRDTTFWVKLQCKQCGNEGLNTTIRYINNIIRTQPTGYHDREYVVSTHTEGNPYLDDFGTKTVQKDQENPSFAQAGSKLNPAPIAALTGVPINADDLINWWMYGPFRVETCPEAEIKCESLDADANGVYKQKYKISAETQFGAGYCELDYEGTGNSGAASKAVEVQVNCTMPGCIEGTFFKDENQNGVREINEVYLKSPGASVLLPGSYSGIQGAVERFQQGDVARGLQSIWNSSGVPAFRGSQTENLTPSKYRAVLDINSSGWSQTTFPGWRDVAANKRVNQLIGVAPGYPVTISCGVYSGGSLCGDNAISGSEQCDGSNLNSVSCQIKGFQGGTLSCNNDCSFNTNSCANASTVTTATATATSFTTITIGGEVVDNGGGSVTARGVVWSTSANPTIALATKTSDGSGNGTFTSSMTGLTCGTTYRVRAYATNVITTSYGAEQVVATANCAAPTVTTAAPTATGFATGSAGGEVTSDGGRTVTARGVVWSTSANPTIALTTKTSDGSGNGTFTSSITGLTCGTTYNVRAYATNSIGTSYGANQTVRTTCVVPTVTTGVPTLISYFGSPAYRLTGVVVDNGGQSGSPNQYGLVWSASPNPTLQNGTPVTLSPFQGFTGDIISGFVCGTTYNVRAYATNYTGTGYGQNQTFTTANCVAPTVTTASLTVTGQTTATAGGDVTNNGGVAVTARGVVWSTSDNPTIALATKTSDGSGNGTFTSSITGLTCGTTYRVRTYATNTIGTNYGTQQIITPQCNVLPTVSGTKVGIMSTGGVMFAANRTSAGFANGVVGVATAQGFCYGTTANPTTNCDNQAYPTLGNGEYYVQKSAAFTPGVTYYYRGYVTTAAGTSYSTQDTFRVSPIAYVGGNAGATYMTGGVSGATTLSIPSHQAGDLLIMFAYRDNFTALPTVPTGWTLIDSGSSNTNSSLVAYRIATAGNLNSGSGTWSNATGLVVHIYRGQKSTSPIGGKAKNGNNTAAVNYPAVTMSQSTGSSLLVFFAGHTSVDTNLNQTPAVESWNPGYMYGRNNFANTINEVNGNDSRAGVKSWPSTNVTVGGTQGMWRTHVVEILAP